MRIYEHPKSQKLVYGMQLAPGAILQRGDVYASTTGEWETCPCPGAMLGSVTSIWVRPEVGLTNDALSVLVSLIRLGGEWCVAVRRLTFYLIPGPGWNWDGRLQPVEISCGECIQELVDFGFLESMTHLVEDINGDYAAVAWRDSENHVFLLTDAGRREVEQGFS